MYPQKKKSLNTLLKIVKLQKFLLQSKIGKKNKGYLGNNSDDYNLSANFSGWEEVLDK